MSSGHACGLCGADLTRSFVDLGMSPPCESYIPAERIGRPSVYHPLTEDVAQRKVELLNKCYPSQRGRDWWDDEVFPAARHGVPSTLRRGLQLREADHPIVTDGRVNEEGGTGRVMKRANVKGGL